MKTLLATLALTTGVVVSGVGLIIVFTALFVGFFALGVYWWRQVRAPLGLARLPQNPILEPIPTHWWESEAVFNPAALYDGRRVHLLYRALGADGISRLGYASSPDGIHFDERLPHPVFEVRGEHFVPQRRLSYAPLTYNPGLWASGGGWGGSEDPRLVKIGNEAYMTFTAFQGWDSARMGLTSIALQDLAKHHFAWRMPALISPPHEVHKNWLLFPEKINGKYAMLTSISPKIAVTYLKDLAMLDDPDTYIKSPGRSGGRKGHWDSVVRGAGAPPLKTKEGWLLLYHAMDEHDPSIGYKVGAMLLDFNDPTKILYRAAHPILQAKEWYENDWKEGVTYASGAVIVGSDLIVYYGGGDKRIAAARANLNTFLNRLTTGAHATLEPIKL